MALREAEDDLAMRAGAPTGGKVARTTGPLRICSTTGLVGQGGASVLIDQEGGRLRGLRPPQGPLCPAGSLFGTICNQDPPSGLHSAGFPGWLIAAEWPISASRSTAGRLAMCQLLASEPWRG